LRLALGPGRPRQEEEPATVLRSLLADIAYDAWLKETCDNLEAAEKRMENVLELTGWLTRLAKQEQQNEPSTFAELVARLSLIGMLDNETTRINPIRCRS